MLGTSLMQALYSMVNLKNLSLTFDACGDLMTDHPLADLGMLDDHSVAIESLRIEFANQTPYKVIGRLYDSLSFLSPSSVDITMEKLFNDEKYPLDRFFFRNKDHIFPHGSTIRIHVSGMRKTLDSQTSGGLLTELVEGCQIAHTIHLEVPDVSLIRLQSTNWSHFSSLRHLRFKGCDNLTEPEVDELVRNLMCGNAEGMGLQSLEIFSCEKISEEFLVELGDNVGPKLTWKMCDCE
ncbi:hypothetical protein BD410DRAFT_293912 [Rickenella mellea]|uniref:RNI-like protein n=1 Tax=Rickenella mellea TaxID=50990 RepID=A0A4Y7Q1J3_9AGAM|nr:hypothetical protein BD410DRAFT_293912 [Rickenella mellea]